MVAHTYHTASRQLLAQGRAELDAGDVRQASEKGGEQRRRWSRR